MPSNAFISAPVSPSSPRRDMVAEVQARGTGFERQTIYRCLRRMTGHERGSAYHDLEDLGDALRLRR